LLENLQLNISFAKALNKMPIYAKLMKEVLSKKKELPKGKSVVLTGSYKAIFQGQLPLKKKDPGSFNSIGKSSIKEGRCSLGEGINLTPTWLMGKLESIQLQPSTFNLTLADGVMNNVVVQENTSSNMVTSETQNKTHLLQKS